MVDAQHQEDEMQFFLRWFDIEKKVLVVLMICTAFMLVVSNFQPKRPTATQVTSIALAHDFPNVECQLFDAYYSNQLVPIAVYECLYITNGNITYSLSRHFVFIGGRLKQIRFIPTYPFHRQFVSVQV